MTTFKDMTALATYLATLAAMVSAVALVPSSALADAGSSCHFHGSKPAEESVVLGCAAQRIEVLVKKGKVDASWKGKTHESIEVVEMPKGKEWKVTFSNPAAKDALKSKLYLYFTHTGNFLAANHTGK